MHIRIIYVMIAKSMQIHIERLRSGKCFGVFVFLWGMTEKLFFTWEMNKFMSECSLAETKNAKGFDV